MRDARIQRLNQRRAEAYVGGRCQISLKFMMGRANFQRCAHGDLIVYNNQILSVILPSKVFTHNFLIFVADMRGIKISG